MDKGSVEYLGPYGLWNILYYASNIISGLSTGVITSYALYTFIALILYLFNSYISIYFTIVVLFVFLFVLNSDSNDEIKRQTILQSSMNPGSNNNNNPENKSDSDVNMEDYSESSDSSSDHPETPEEVRNRNERDLDTVESLIDENKRLKDLFGTAEKIRDKKSISETEYGNYLHANSPTLNNIEAEIRRNEEEIERLEEKMVRKTATGLRAIGW